LRSWSSAAPPGSWSWPAPAPGSAGRRHRGPWLGTPAGTGRRRLCPGLLGYGAYALLTRVAYALGDGRSPALGALAGFGSATVLSFLAYPFFHGASLIAALAGAFSVGMTLAAALMLHRLSASAGPEAFAGVLATCGRALAAAAAAVVAGSSPERS